MVIFISSDLCHDDSTKFLINNGASVQYISTHIIQCKYNSNFFLQLIPWFWVLLALWTAIIFDSTNIHLDYKHNTYESHMTFHVISSLGIICMTLGSFLVIRFDEWNLVGVRGSNEYVGYGYNPGTMHGVGVMLLLIGIFTLNTITCVLLWLQRQYGEYRVTLMLAEYEFIELIYVFFLVAFAVTFAIREETAAASFEYVLLGLTIFFALLSRQIRYLNF